MTGADILTLQSIKAQNGDATTRCPVRVKSSGLTLCRATSGLPLNSDIAQCSRHFAFVPTANILGAIVVASGRDASRVVAAYLPPTEPRGAGQSR
jgi:hypothetical protein